MTSIGLSGSLARMSESLHPSAHEARSDGLLLTAFLTRQDEGAFAELIARFGPMVFAVCHSITGHRQDAEDAFQATFVVLARKAAVVSPREAVGNWLYGVAVRTAREARKMAAKRLAREVPASHLPDAGTCDPEPDDVGAVLHEELAELPDKFRTLLVLCELEGRPQVEVARRLALPVGTVYSRLAAARKLLADRLRKRGVILSAGGLPLAFTYTASAAVPVGLAARAGKAALTPDNVPAAVAALTQQVLQAMLLSKLKVPGLVAVLLVFGGLLGGLSGGDPPPASPVPNTVPPAVPLAAVKRVSQQPAPKAPAPGRLLLWNSTKFVFLTPDGKEEGTVDPHPDKGIILVQPSLAPDGKRVAFIANETLATDTDGTHKAHVYYRDVDGKTPGVKVELNPVSLAWEPDGKSLIVTEMPPFKDLKDAAFVVWQVNVATKEKTKLDLPKLALVYGATPDGKSFIAALHDVDARKIHLSLIPRDGKDVTKLCEVQTEGPNPRMSPDGTKILFQDHDPDEKPEKDLPHLLRLFVYDVKAKTRTRLAEVPLNASVVGYCWSPDGKRLAYTWKAAKPGVPLAANNENINDPKLNTETESYLTVCEASGNNPKTVLSEKANFAPTITIGAVDWR
jgi:RNA polymerase sigma factor (sigma-70 family)